MNPVSGLSGYLIKNYFEKTRGSTNLHLIGCLRDTEVVTFMDSKLSMVVSRITELVVGSVTSLITFINFRYDENDSYANKFPKCCIPDIYKNSLEIQNKFYKYLGDDVEHASSKYYEHILIKNEYTRDKISQTL